LRFPKCVAFLIAAIGLAVGLSGALAEGKSFGPFSVDPGQPEVVKLEGAISPNSALDFRRALNAAPGAKLVVLDSPGGSVSMALLIADDIFQRKLSTLIPADAACYSACAYLFLAGAERVVEGKLGVHQISADTPDLETAQLAISDIIDLLNKFETPIEVLTVMFRTPSNSMHVFSSQEIAEYRIEKRAPATAASSPPETSTTPNAGAAAGGAPTAAASPVASPATPPPAGFSVIESYARRPNRVAVYAGLDFFGADLSVLESPDLAACAARCLDRVDACKAFTFNAETTAGPNCFLKGEGTIADGNAVAISGVLLRRSDPEPVPVVVGVIDPRLGLVRDMDFPGGDLGKRPLASATTAQACRLACVQNRSCAAFTFVKERKQCWLKAEPFGAQVSTGAVSGRKSTTTFSPVRIIQLD
jgi:hypothetical protein